MAFISHNNPKETIGDLLVAVLNRKELLPSSMGEFRRTVITNAIPDVKANTVIVKGESYGTGAVYNKAKLVKNAIYPLNIKFYNVSFSDKKNNKHSIRVNTGHGNFIWQEPLRKNRHPVEIRCTCKDHYFRFWWWDDKTKSHFGRKFPKYVRKTDTRPEVNPGHHSGFCKHLYSLVLKLEQEGLLKK